MRKAYKNDKKLVSDILTSAFLPLKDGSSINLVVKQDNKREKRMRILMNYLFERALLFGDIFISDNEKACLLISFSSKEKVTLKTILLDLDLAINCIGINRVFKVLKRQKLVQSSYPKEDYIKPMILGVLNTEKSNGSAARLIIEVINHHKNNTLPVITNAADEKNVALYKKFGFKVFNKVESLGFPLYFLRMN